MRPSASVPPSRGQQRRRAIRRARRPWWQGPAPIIGTLLAVVAVVAIMVALAQKSPTGPGSAQIGQPVSATVAQQVTSVSPSVFSTVGTGGRPLPIASVTGQAPLQDASGKPEVLYVGGDFCPYCAAERWSLVVALSRFGTFANLHYMQSSSTDIFPNTHTFTFAGSSYTSTYLSFVPREQEDRNQKPLETLTSQQQQLFSTLGRNSYPFVDIANRYTGAVGYDTAILQGLTWEQIAAKLSNPQDPVTRGIVGNANYLTAAICQTTNNQPGSVCAAAPIPQLQALLPKG